MWASHTGRILIPGGGMLGSGKQLREASQTGFPHGRPGTLTMQRDGNLVHRCGSSVDWQSRTHVAGSTLRVTLGGLLQVVGPHGRTVWSRGSSGHQDVYFNGALMDLEDYHMRPLWEGNLNWRVCVVGR